MAVRNMQFMTEEQRTNKQNQVKTTAVEKNRHQNTNTKIIIVNTKRAPRLRIKVANQNLVPMRKSIVRTVRKTSMPTVIK